MTFDDYIDEVKLDGIEFINESYEYYTDFEDIYDAMWCEDSVTGNASGSYTFNAAKAEKNVADLFWDDTFRYEMQCMGLNDLIKATKDGPEALDVTARCLALSYCRDDFEDAWDKLHDNCEE